MHNVADTARYLAKLQATLAHQAGRHARNHAQMNKPKTLGIDFIPVLTRFVYHMQF